MADLDNRDWYSRRLACGKSVRSRGMDRLSLISWLGSPAPCWAAGFSVSWACAYGLIGRLVMSVVGAIVLLLLVRALKRA